MALSANSFGNILSCTTFGESHGPAMGVVINGFPAGVEIDQKLLKDFLARRKPGTSKWVSARAEADEPQILSGVFEGKSLGTPIAVIVPNLDARSQDYIKIPPRAGHADDVWREKFGHSDPRGGGRSSGRETLCRVIAGAFACMLVRALSPSTKILAWSEKIGEFELNENYLQPNGGLNLTFDSIEESVARFPASIDRQAALASYLEDAKTRGKSYGGVAALCVKSPPPMLGQPVFKKLKSELAAAFMSVGATAGFELGEGFEVVGAEGSQFHSEQVPNSKYGGIRGGISTGEDIFVRVAFKPTSSVLDVAKKGRHDPCIVPRAVPVLEAMAWWIVADQILWRRLDRV